MNKIDRLSLTKDQVNDRLRGILSFDQATIALFGRSTTLNHREREQFRQRYGTDIASIVAENKQNSRTKLKQEEMNRIFVCDYCRNEYRNGDHHCDNRSGRHFCSDSCSRKYSANVNKEERLRKTSESMKRYCREHTHTLLCEKCGKPFQAGPKAIHGKCKECIDAAVNNNLLMKQQVRQHGICTACGSITGSCRRPEVCRSRNVFATLHDVFGFDISSIGTERVYDEFDKVKDMLNELYWNRNMSIPDIFNMFRHKTDSSYFASTGNFLKLLRRFIKVRNVSEGQRLQIETCQRSYDDDFTTSYHTTWNRKVFICRSTYETDLCRELDAGEIDYMIEPFTLDYYDSIQNCRRFAVPDFYLPEYNMIMEVKSSFTYDRQNMIDKAKAYMQQGYNFILEYEHKSYTFEDMVAEVFDMEKNLTYYKNKAKL